jgi:L-alanine-DL-glutamate epimerase-like enolase superfamily enzyme
MPADDDFTITELRIRRFRYQRSWASYFGHTVPASPNEQTEVLFEVVTKGGAAGYAFGLDPGLATFLDHQLTGQNALYREKIWRQLSEFQRGMGAVISDYQLSIVDSALWDLAGRAAGLPVYQLIGAFRDRVPAYASTMAGDADLPGGLNTPEDFADYAQACYQLGYRAFKLHTWLPPVPGAPSVERDIAACTAVRERVGDTMELMLDPYHFYDRQQAKRLGRALEELDFLWLEEPMRETSISSYRWLCDQLDIDVLGPETAPGQVQTRAEWVLAGAADILRAGIVDVGGITPLLKIAHLAEAHGISLELHRAGAATLHVLGAMPIAGRYYERGLLHPLIEYETRTPWLTAVVDPLDADGCVTLPAEPGLGWCIDWDFIAANEVS